MKPAIIWICAAAALAVMAAAYVLLAFPPASPGSGTDKEGTVTFGAPSSPQLYVEVADTPAERSTGLMNREYIAPDEGMIFIFSGEYPETFWMKNTLIPLDMIFVNSSMDIVKIHHDVQPCVSDPCPTYPSGRPVLYVVEANAGYATANGIEEGQRISFSLYPS